MIPNVHDKWWCWIAPGTDSLEPWTSNTGFFPTQMFVHSPFRAAEGPFRSLLFHLASKLDVHSSGNVPTTWYNRRLWRSLSDFCLLVVPKLYLQYYISTRSTAWVVGVLTFCPVNLIPEMYIRLMDTQLLRWMKISCRRFPASTKYRPLHSALQVPHCSFAAVFNVWAFRLQTPQSTLVFFVGSWISSYASLRVLASKNERSNRSPSSNSAMALSLGRANTLDPKKLSNDIRGFLGRCKSEERP